MTRLRPLNPVQEIPPKHPLAPASFTCNHQHAARTLGPAALQEGVQHRVGRGLRMAVKVDLPGQFQPPALDPFFAFAVGRARRDLGFFRGPPGGGDQSSG